MPMWRSTARSHMTRRVRLRASRPGLAGPWVQSGYLVGLRVEVYETTTCVGLVGVAEPGNWATTSLATHSVPAPAECLVTWPGLHCLVLVRPMGACPFCVGWQG